MAKANTGNRRWWNATRGVMITLRIITRFLMTQIKGERMKVYDEVYGSDRHRDAPNWVAVDLSKEDEANIEGGDCVLTENPQMLAVVLPFHGRFILEDGFTISTANIVVHRKNGVWLELTEPDHEYATSFKVRLDSGEAEDYAWDGEKVVWA